MTLVLEIDPLLEQRLNHGAAQRGMTTEQFARYLFDRLAAVDSDEAWEADLDAFAANAADLPVLAPEATSRERIYGERG